jgi:hypothetical protein
MGQLVGVLAIVVLLTSLFKWLIKRLSRAELQSRPVLQIVLANALSLTAYTIAMGFDPPSKWWTPLISSYWSWKGV